MKIPLKRLLPDVPLPVRANSTDAGYDLFNMDDYDYFLRPGERKLFRTGLSMAIPAGFYGRIADRSGLALRQGIHVLGGVIDSGFLGEIGVILLNTQGEDTAGSVKIDRSMRIAQLIIEKCETAEFEITLELLKTDRGNGGFGSTGTK